MELQIALLNFLLTPKTIRGTAKRDVFKRFDRKHIIDVKKAMLTLGLLEIQPGLKTAGQRYKTTKAGRRYLSALERKEIAL